MKNFRNNNTCRRVVALLMSLVILTLAVPSALADNASFAGTRWYATNFNLDLIKAVDRDVYNQIMAIAQLASFVPDTSWLEYPSVMGICCTLDFSRNGTCTITFLASAFGTIDWSSYSSTTASWSSAGNMLRLTVDGDSVPMTYRNGVLSLSVYGLGLDFAQI